MWNKRNMRYHHYIDGGHRHYIIGEKEAKRIAALRHGRPIVMIDIAVPRY